jgi:hypothetical protein
MVPNKEHHELVVFGSEKQGEKMKKGEDSYLGRPLPPMKMSRHFSWLFNESKKK